MMRKMQCSMSLIALTLLAPTSFVQAQTPAAPPPAPAARPAPYSLPWLMRPVAAAHVVRVDETMAFLEDPALKTSGATYVSGLTATYRLNPRWVPVFRVMWVKHDAPGGGRELSGSSFSNPIVGINYVRPLSGGWRWSAFGASSLPISSAGGDKPDPGAAAAVAAGIPARSGMDNTLFAVNYWGLVGGLGVARVTPELTLQAEATVFQLTRVRGPKSQDSRRTNFTAGVHVGHFVSPKMSLGAEVHMQRWLTDAAPVRANAAARDQFTFSFGPRFHFKAGRRMLRPGVSYTRALDAPMKTRGYDILQIDFPVAF